MLKVIGAALLILACGSLGLGRAAAYRRRPAELRAIRSALTMLETEIVYGATALPEAFARVSRRCDRAVAPLFQAAAEELEAMSGLTAAEAWDRALRFYYPATSLAPQDLAPLRDLGASLGVSDREDQRRHLRLAVEQLGAGGAAAELEAAKNEKIWSYMGFLGGLMIVLLLI
ncbi:MAG: stage III sporulation protein AB [Firmicutes bacterium]|nr:stage III sporulation protein AB [Bacillota bacterium]